MESEGQPESTTPIPEQPWQYGLWTMFAIVAFCALPFALWKVGGGASVRSASCAGILLGIPITFLGKSKFLIFSGAIAGAILGTMLGLSALGIDVERLNNHDPGQKLQYEVQFLPWWQIGGTLAGPALIGAFVWAMKRWRWS
jgi:hypothetical protein